MRQVLTVLLSVMLGVALISCAVLQFVKFYTDTGYVEAVTSDSAEFVVIYLKDQGAKLYYNPYNLTICNQKYIEITYVSYEGPLPKNYTLPVTGAINSIKCFDEQPK